MKLTPSIRLSLALATLACAGSAQAQSDARTPATTTPTPAPKIEMRAATIPEWRIANGSLMTAVDQLGVGLRSRNLPAMNVVFAPEARTAEVPEMVLQNVSGPDALRLLTVSAGCDMEEIGGTDGQTIGYRVFPSPRLAFNPATGTPIEGGGGVPNTPAPVFPSFGGVPGAPMTPGVGQPPIYGGGGLGGVKEAAPMPGMPGIPGAAGGVLNFAGMPAANPNNVSVYSLGAITNTTKFDELEKTLRDILKSGGVSADAAKLAFHDKTNVLVVNADAQVHQMVSQFLEAMQKNVAAAAAQEKREGSERRELIEAMLRLDAEREQRMRVTKQLEESEARMLTLQRELDRIKASAPKAP